MPQVKFAAGALRDIQRLREFLRPQNPAAAKRAADAIIKATRLLLQQPLIGRLVAEHSPEQRELVIEFGDHGYIALYAYSADVVTVLSVRHQRERSV
ncbi:MAG: plasmid stabilization protein [Lysobacterales bacterium CG02_land_8_20_14_3_00_62_12]|nr:MAG: plasmid stabilization protein [Xanthomonadales bacterium CG02_land_8_20_14_3_00_62_12]PJA42504.1 MAG: plasmid stabilization protein [Xanthomonadales bacterium CG_4_9_14_3_um_filter_62_6]